MFYNFIYLGLMIRMLRHIMLIGSLTILMASTHQSIAHMQGCIDCDSDGLNDVFEDELISRFAPVVRLHPDESHLPASVDWMLPQFLLAFYTRDRPPNGGPTDRILNKGEVTAASLLNFCRTKEGATQCSGLEPSNNPDVVTDITSIRTDFFLTFPDDPFSGNANPADWACYAHVMRAPAHHPYMYDIQYYFPYTFSGGLGSPIPYGEHEGDWEHISIRVNSDGQTIHSVYFAAHDDEGRWYYQTAGAVQGYNLISGRPLVYSAKSSHASYPWAGVWDRDWNNVDFILPDDHTADGGAVWDCRNNVINLGEKRFPRHGFSWLQFSGQWGDCDYDVEDPISPHCGPYGPAYQKAWYFGDSLKGDDPYEFGWRFVNKADSNTQNLGTWEEPYQRIVDATSNVPSNGNIVILPGNYSAIGTYSNPATLHAPEGDVVLGQ